MWNSNNSTQLIWVIDCTGLIVRYLSTSWYFNEGVYTTKRGWINIIGWFVSRSIYYLPHTWRNIKLVSGNMFLGTWYLTRTGIISQIYSLVLGWKWCDSLMNSETKVVLCKDKTIISTYWYRVFYTSCLLFITQKTKMYVRLNMVKWIMKFIQMRCINYL